jgi:hypothetical protein
MTARAKPHSASTAKAQNGHVPEPDVSDIPETSFQSATRNPYVVVLAPDMRRLFPTSEAVDTALREYAQTHGLQDRAGARPTS